jgi:hypothetical protein
MVSETIAACRILVYSMIWPDRESYRSITAIMESMVTIVLLREIYAVYTSIKY